MVVAKVSGRPKAQLRRVNNSLDVNLGFFAELEE